jgi:ADP-ribosyl-[dinitrogen reductase] hydrolase
MSLGHDTPSMGGVVSIPIIVLLFHKDEELCLSKCREHLFLTHKSNTLASFVNVYARILCRVLNTPTLLSASQLRDIIGQECSKSGIQELKGIPGLVQKYPQKGDYRMDCNVIGGTFSSACYIDDSMPSLLYLAYKYSDSLEEALIANTNVGGENCHRGAVLGALLGAALGQEAIPGHFKTRLEVYQDLEKESELFFQLLQNGNEGE